MCDADEVVHHSQKAQGEVDGYRKQRGEREVHIYFMAQPHHLFALHVTVQYNLSTLFALLFFVLLFSFNL